MRKHLTHKICFASKTQLLFCEMYNRKLATLGNQDTRPRQTKQRSATQYVMDTTTTHNIEKYNIYNYLLA
jgi:hypothetical protein